MQIFCNGFTFLNHTSSEFDLLTCVTFNNSSVKEEDVSMKLKLDTIRTGNSSYNRIINAKFENALVFEIHMIKKSQTASISYETERRIYKWLTGMSDYSPIYIDNERFQNTYFNVIVSNLKPIKNGEETIGFMIEFTCDAPHAWEDFSHIFDVSNTLETTLLIDTDDNSNKVYPKITVLAAGQCDFSITNSDNITQSVTEVLASETMVIDNQNALLSSNINNRNLYRNFNKKWFYLSNGTNHISIKSNGRITISYSLPRKVGL